MHVALLEGIDWQQTDNIGRRSGTGLDPVRLRIALADASLTIEHPGALIDHVYLAFDGLTAALVNMTDTLGRLVIGPTVSALIREGQACWLSVISAVLHPL